MNKPEPTPLQAVAKPIVATLATLAATGAWLIALGSAVFWARLDQLAVAPAPTVAQLPTDLRLVVGARYLLVPLGLAVLAVVVLLALRGHAPDRQVANARDQTPFAYREVAGALGVLGVVAIIIASPSTVGGLLMVVIIIAFVAATWRLMLIVTGFAEGALLLFFSVLIASGLLAVTVEATTEPQLDIAVVERKDKTALGGFYLGASDERVMLLGAAVPGGQAANEVFRGRSARRLPVPRRRCDETDERAPIGSGSTRCYINETVVIPADDVRKLTIGPRGQTVDADGYAAARQLAQLVLRRGDEERLTPARQSRSRRCTPARRRAGRC